MSGAVVFSGAANIEVAAPAADGAPLFPGGPAVSNAVTIAATPAAPAIVAPALPFVGSGQLFTFVQSVPAAVWTIDHRLGLCPSVVVVDSAGTVVDGDIQYVSLDRIVLTFIGGFSGTCYLN